jgi:hypothetical protein
MKPSVFTGLVAFGLAALFAAAGPERRSAPPSDLRDAMSDGSALDQLGISPADASAVPAPQAVQAAKSFSAADRRKDPGLLLTEAYSKEDIIDLIGSTSVGSELLGGFRAGRAELPEFAHRAQLSAQDQEFTRNAVLTHQENMIALFIKSPNFRGNRAHIVFYKTDWPLFGAACVTAHELQHALDGNSPWHRRLDRLRDATQKKVDKAYASGSLTLEDMALEDSVYGLGYATTLFSEYLAYSRSSALLAELAGGDAALRARLMERMKLKNSGKSIVEDDPLHNPADRQDFMARYFWPGNSRRFKAGINVIFKNERLLAELKAAGLGTALDELAAYRDTPEHNVEAPHSLR